MIERLQDFAHLETYSDSGTTKPKMWSRLVDDNGSILDPLPVRSNLASDLPYDSFEDIPESVLGTVMLIDRAYLVEGLMDRFAMWRNGMYSLSTSIETKAVPASLDSHGLMDIVTGIHVLAKGWDALESSCTGWSGAIKNVDEMISEFSSWVPLGKNIELKWNFRQNQSNGPAESGPPSQASNWRNAPELQDTEDQDNSSCVNWKKMFRAAVAKYANRDFISVKRFLGKEPDDDLEHGKFSWKDVDDYEEDPFRFVSGRDIMCLFSDLESIDAVLSRFHNTSSSQVVSGSFSSAGQTVYQWHSKLDIRPYDLDSTRPDGCGRLIERNGHGDHSEESTTYKTPHSRTNIIPSGDYCTFDALSDEYVLPSATGIGGGVRVITNCLALSAKSSFIGSLSGDNDVICYADWNCVGHRISKKSGLDMEWDNVLDAQISCSGQVTVDYSSMLDGSTEIDSAYIFIFAVSSSGQGKSNYTEQSYLTTVGSYYCNFDSEYIYEYNGSCRFGVFCKLLECTIQNGNKIIIPPVPDDFPEPNGGVTINLVQTAPSPTSKSGQLIEPTNESTKWESEQKRVFSYGPLLIKAKFASSVKGDD